MAAAPVAGSAPQRCPMISTRVWAQERQLTSHSPRASPASTLSISTTASIAELAPKSAPSSVSTSKIWGRRSNLTWVLSSWLQVTSSMTSGASPTMATASTPMSSRASRWSGSSMSTAPRWGSSSSPRRGERWRASPMSSVPAQGTPRLASPIAAASVASMP